MFDTVRSSAKNGGNSGFALPYSPGLDGLRALAVLAVLLYHADVTRMRGGFLGVEVFFVISGFLITSLLLAEYRKTGTVDLIGFWFRRARRLLPAVFFMMIATATYAVAFLPEEVAGLRADILAAAGYVTNWYLVFAGESYFEAVGRPSLLKHLWSLAVEEQFYLVWPVVVALGLLVFRRGGVLVLTVLGVAGSAALMFYLYTPTTDPSRLYYGTDTRAAGLLVGAALAFFCVPGRGFVNPNRSRGNLTPGGKIRHKFGWVSPAFLDVFGLLALAGIAWAFLNAGEFDPLLYRGGLLAVSLMSAVLIAAVVHPHAHLGAIFGVAPLRWIGVRSYGIYLWHWPVFMVTRPDLDIPADVLSGWQLFAARMLATLILADFSYRFVETPIRRGRLGAAIKDLRRAHGRRKTRLGLRWGAATVFCTALAAVIGSNMVTAQPPETPEYLQKQTIRTSLAPEETAEPETAEPEEQREVEEPSIEETSTEETEIEEPIVEETTVEETTVEEVPVPVAPAPITAIGDSVMLGASDVLAERVPEVGITDSSVGMQVADAISILEARRDASQLGNSVVLHIGTNGTFTADEFDEIMSILQDVERVYFINVKAPRSWEVTNNEVIRAGVEEYENTVLIDWNAASSPHPEYFYGDGIHPAPEGAQTYAELIRSELGI